VIASGFVIISGTTARAWITVENRFCNICQRETQHSVSNQTGVGICGNHPNCAPLQTQNPNPAPPPQPVDNRPLHTRLGSVLTTYIFPTVILASIIWAVFMGIQFGTATDEGKRKQVKDRFIKALATVVIIVVLYGIMIGYQLD